MLLRLLDRLEEIIITTLIALATALIFVAVLHRYGASNSIALAKWADTQGFAALAGICRSIFAWLSSWDLSWNQELCIYMFVWMAKFGAAYGVRTGIHVGVDVLVNMLGPRHRQRVVLFGLLCGALFTAVVGTFGALFVHHNYEFGGRSNDLEVRMWIVYLAIPLGSFLMCFRFLQVAWRFARTGELPEHNEAHVEGLETEAAARGRP